MEHKELTLRKIVFLDCDGVLNSHRTFFGTGKLPFRFIESHKPHFDWIAIGMLVRLVTDDPAIRFVLSSSWRIDGKRTPEEVANEAGAFLGLPFVGCTDTNGPHRGEEIQRWLDAHPEVEQYCIVDDDSDMLESQAPHFVQTLFADGMRYAHFKAMQRILDGKLGGLYRRERFWENRDEPCSQDEYDQAGTAGFIDNGPKPEKVIMRIYDQAGTAGFIDNGPKPEKVIMHMEPASIQGITIVKGEPTPEVLAAMNKATNEWFDKAARKECGWCCPDCCMSFHEGMPEFCGCGAFGCDALLVRDLIAANKSNPDVDFGFRLMDKHGKANDTPKHILDDGDSINSICDIYGISREDFDRWNGFQHGHSWPTPVDKDKGYSYVYIACPTDKRLTVAQVRSIGEPQPTPEGCTWGAIPPASKDVS